MFLLLVLVGVGVCYYFSNIIVSLFQVLCQVLASNGRGNKSYDLLSRKQIMCAPVQIFFKSPVHLFYLNF